MNGSVLLKGSEEGSKPESGRWLRMQIAGGAGDYKGRKERANQQDFANNRLDDQCIESMRTIMKKKEEDKEPTLSSAAPCSP